MGLGLRYQQKAESPENGKPILEQWKPKSEMLVARHSWGDSESLLRQMHHNALILTQLNLRRRAHETNITSFAVLVSPVTLRSPKIYGTAPRRYPTPGRPLSPVDPLCRSGTLQSVEVATLIKDSQPLRIPRRVRERK